MNSFEQSTFIFDDPSTYIKQYILLGLREQTIVEFDVVFIWEP